MSGTALATLAVETPAPVEKGRLKLIFTRIACKTNSAMTAVTAKRYQGDSVFKKSSLEAEQLARWIG